MDMRTNGVDLAQRRARGATAESDGGLDLKVHKQQYGRPAGGPVEPVYRKDTNHAVCPVRNDNPISLY